MNSISPIKLNQYKYKNPISFGNNKPEKQNDINKKRLKSHNFYYGISSNLLSSKPQKRQKPALFFSENLNAEEKLLLEDTTGIQKQVLEKMLKLKTTEGKNFFVNNFIKLFKLNQLGLSNQALENIIKRNLINEKITNIFEFSDFADLNDEQWEKIKDISHSLYETLKKNDFTIYSYYGNENPLQEYKIGKINYEQLYELYAICKITDFLDNESDEKIKTFSKAVNLYQNAIKMGNSQQEALKLIFELIKNKKLQKNSVFYSTLSCNINPNLEADLQKLKSFYTQKTKPQKVFVPHFKTKEEAISNLNIGDTCILKDNKYISIKTDKNEIEELYITPKTYLELFPPVERYICNQQHSGDCYLMSVIDEVYANPNTRVKILELFAENPDGTISMNFGGFKITNGNITPKTGGDSTIKDLEEELGTKIRLTPHLYSASCEGKRAIQTLWEKYYKNKSDSYVREFKNQLNKAKEKKLDSIKFNNIEYTKKDIDSFLEMYKSEYNLIAMGINNETHCIDYEDLKTLYFAVSTKKIMNQKFGSSDKYIKQENKDLDFLIKSIQRYIKAYKNEDKIQYIEVMPLRIALLLSKIRPKDVNANNYFRIDGGYSMNVLAKLGISSKIYTISKNQEIISKIFNDEDFASNYLVFGSTKSTQQNNSDDSQKIEKTLNQELGLYSNHSYIIRPIKTENNELEYKIRNPWNTTFETHITQKELEEYFNLITVGYIKPNQQH